MYYPSAKFGDDMSSSFCVIALTPWTAPSRTMDRLSPVRLLMGKKPYSGTADSGAAVTQPNTETTGRLGIELADSSLVHQCCNTCIFKLSHCLVT